MPLAFSTGSFSHPKNTMYQSWINIKTVVLLYILLPGVMPSSLATINPWLSGCDISEPMPYDMQGACNLANPHQLHKKMQRELGEMSCPRSCPLNHSSPNAQCLAYLDQNQRNAICNFSPGSGRAWLKTFLGQIRLRHCCEHKVIESLSGILLEKVYRGKEECFHVIDHLVNVDNLAAHVSCEFSEVLARFDCDHPYSVRFSCDHCKEAYRRWVCSSLIPYFNGTQRIRPCRTICQVVEQKCPYFLPENRAPSLPTQYAGEPAFLCVDPNIPESFEQQERSIYPRDDSCCFKPCGAPYDGYCIKPGITCNDPSSYENATRDDCNSTEANSIRMSNGRCSGPTMHPGSRATSVTGATSDPVVLVISSFVALQATYPQSRRQLLILFPILLAFHSPSHGTVRLPEFPSFASLPPITDLVGINMSHHFFKIPKSIFNYFKFTYNKWKYYFTLLWVKLRTGITLPPRATPPQSPLRRDGQYWLRKEYIRGEGGARFIPTFTLGAQRFRRRMFFGLEPKTRKSFLDCLLTGTLATNECGTRTDFNGSTSNTQDYSTIMLTTVPLKILDLSLNYRMREVCNELIERLTSMNYSRGSLNVRLLLLLFVTNAYIRMNIVYKIILMVLYSSKSYKYAFYYVKKYIIGKKSKKKNKKKRRKVRVRVAVIRIHKPSLRDSAIAKI